MLGAMTDRTEQAESEYLRPGDAARRLSLHPRTLTRMAERGQIRSITLPSGHRRYASEDIDALLERQPA